MYLSDLSESERYAAFLIQALDGLKGDPADFPDGKASHGWIAKQAISAIGDAGGIGLSFGIGRGQSLNHTAARRPDLDWFGFDSFAGYPADGRFDWQRSPAMTEPERTPDNVTLVRGLFSDTLPDFLAEQTSAAAFIDMSCDLYSSTSDVFRALEAHRCLQAGVPILFNQIINCPDAIWNEMRALYEMLERTGLGLRWQTRLPNVWLGDETLDLLEICCYPDAKEMRDAGYLHKACLILTGDGIDFGPIWDSAYMARVRDTAALYDKVSDLRRERAHRAAKRRDAGSDRLVVLMHVKADQNRNAAEIAEARRRIENVVKRSTEPSYGQRVAVHP